MALIAIPNVSEGRDRLLLERFAGSMSTGGTPLLDLHADPQHHRSVFTTTGSGGALVAGMTALAVAARSSLDLTDRHGVHPRLGVLDVCPFVPHEEEMSAAIESARAAGAAIATDAGLPVYLYGAAAERDATRDLPFLRRGGLKGLIRAAREGLVPDYGPGVIDQRHGVVCVGARDVLIAFNIWLRAREQVARRIAAGIRTSGGGPPGIRALGVPMGDGLSQVTMNLIDPAVTGIDRAFELVAGAAAATGAEITATEIVGLVPERYLPDPNATAARLLMKPGRSLESVLEGLLTPPG